MRRLHYTGDKTTTILLGIQMRKMVSILFVLSGIALVCMGCQKLYQPNAISGSTNYLVVEGVINPGSDSTIIKLSRTVKINSKSTATPELGAIVTVENGQNAVYPIPEIGNGSYAYPGLNLDNNSQYRLRIKTSDGKEYLSDLVLVKITPPIDSVGFNIRQDSLQIYANAHDP